MSPTRLLALTVVLCLGLARPLSAQDLCTNPDTTLRHSVRSLDCVGALFQFVSDAGTERSEGRSGFSIATLRLMLVGRIDDRFGYFLQGDVVRSPALLDAIVSAAVTPALGLQAGLFKVPVSGEFLVNAANIDFVNRARSVDGFAPGRELGVQANLRSPTKRWQFVAGVFNGNPAAGVNDDDRLLTAVRLSYRAVVDTLSGPARNFKFGINAATSRDAAARVGGATFGGKRSILGGDVRWRLDRFLLAGELLTTVLEDSLTGARTSPAGHQVTTGWYVRPNSQLLLRWDHVRSYLPGQRPDAMILGWNLWPTRHSELQVNWVMRERQDVFRRGQLLVNAQLQL